MELRPNLDLEQHWAKGDVPSKIRRHTCDYVRCASALRSLPPPLSYSPPHLRLPDTHVTAPKSKKKKKASEDRTELEEGYPQRSGHDMHDSHKQLKSLIFGYTKLPRHPCDVLKGRSGSERSELERCSPPKRYRGRPKELSLTNRVNRQVWDKYLG